MEGVGKMELSDQDSYLALITPTVYIMRICLHIYGCLPAEEPLVSHRLTIQGGGGENTPILFSPLFLVCNWSGVCQSQGT